MVPGSMVKLRSVDGDLGVVYLADMLQFYDGHRFSYCEVKVSLSGGNSAADCEVNELW